MRNQYKVLSEAYSKEVKLKQLLYPIVKKLTELHYPEDKEEFKSIVTKNRELIFEFDGRGPPHIIITTIAEELLNDKITIFQYRTGPVTRTDHFIGVFFVIKRFFSPNSAEDWAHLGPNGIQKEFDKSFEGWCRSMNAKKELYKDNPGVNIDI